MGSQDGFSRFTNTFADQLSVVVIHGHGKDVLQIRIESGDFQRFSETGRNLGDERGSVRSGSGQKRKTDLLASTRIARICHARLGVGTISCSTEDTIGSDLQVKDARLLVVDQSCPAVRCTLLENEPKSGAMTKTKSGARATMKGRGTAVCDIFSLF